MNSGAFKNCNYLLLSGPKYRNSLENQYQYLAKLICFQLRKWFIVGKLSSIKGQDEKLDGYPGSFL